MPSRDIEEGDVIFIRAQVLTHGGDAFQVQIADYPQYAMTCWVPARECAGPEDIHLLLPRRSPA